MLTALAGQANELELPIVAKASGNPITAGTVNFYLVDKDGPNAGKWYRGSDGTWQSSESIGGVATHRARGHWYNSFGTAVWTARVRYRLYADESGSLQVAVGDDVLCETENLDRILNAWFIGTWRLKSGTTNVYELLDPADGSTVILEMSLSQTTPYRSITVKI